MLSKLAITTSMEDSHIVEALRLDQTIYYSDYELYTNFPTE